MSFAVNPRCHPVRREHRNRLAAVFVGLAELREDAQWAMLALAAGHHRGHTDSQLFRGSRPTKIIDFRPGVLSAAKVDEKKQKPGGYDGQRCRSLRGLLRLYRGKRAHVMYILANYPKQLGISIAGLG